MVLVETQGDANIGAVARSMACFGAPELFLVTPRAKVSKNAYDWACHGSPVLDACRTVDRLEEALEGVSLAVAMTARPGKRRHRMVTPAELSESVLPLFPPGPLALVFGNEVSGLANEHLDLCQRRVRIPAQPEHSSLNLAHSVSVMLYELTSRTGGEIGGKPRKVAPAGERQRMLQEVGAFLAETGYPSHHAKLSEEMTKLADMAERTQLEEWEVRYLLGMVRHLRNWFAGKLG